MNKKQNLEKFLVTGGTVITKKPRRKPIKETYQNRAYRILFPYCLKPILDTPKGTLFIVLNRNYKPIGFDTNEHIDYNELKSCHQLFLFSDREVQFLTEDEGMQEGHIFLYKDATNPMNSPIHMKAYMQKLEVLGNCIIQDSHSYGGITG